MILILITLSLLFIHPNTALNTQFIGDGFQLQSTLDKSTSKESEQFLKDPTAILETSAMLTKNYKKQQIWNEAIKTFNEILYDLTTENPANEALLSTGKEALFSAGWKALFPAGSAVANELIEVFKGEHVITRIMMVVAQMIKESKSEDPKINKPPDAGGISRLAAMFQLALPVAGEISMEVITAAIEKFIKGLMTSGAIVDVAATEGPKLVKLVQLAYQYSDIPGAMSYLSRKYATNFETLRHSIGSTLVANSLASAGSYFGKWLPSWSATDGKSQIKSDEAPEQPPQHDLVDLMQDFQKAHTNVGRKLLDDESGCDEYAILTNLSIALILLLSVIFV